MHEAKGRQPAPCILKDEEYTLKYTAQGCVLSTYYNLQQAAFWLPILPLGFKQRSFKLPKNPLW